MPSETRLRIELPDEERGRSPDVVKRFDRLQRKLIHPKLTKKERDVALAELEQIEEAPKRRAEASRDRAAAEEAERLAAGRGEDPGSVTPGFRIDRDPLAILAARSHLTPEQLRTGEAVRDLYERRAEQAGAVEYTGMPGSAHNHEAFVAKGAERAFACADLGRIERQVAIRCSAEPVCLTMLRVVCERGLPVSSQGAGRAMGRNIRALARALDIADLVLRKQIG